MIQNKTALVITDGIKGTHRDRNYQQLGLESSEYRRWSLSLFFLQNYAGTLATLSSNLP